MGTAIEQYYYPAASFTRRIFIDGSGRRTAEPTTVAVAAAQATLTELLLYLAKRLRQSIPGQCGALEMTLTAANLETLDRIKAEFVDLSAIPIVHSIDICPHSIIAVPSQTIAEKQFSKGL